MSEFINFIKSFRRLNESEKKLRKILGSYLTEKETKIIERFYKQKTIKIELSNATFAPVIKEGKPFPLITIKAQDASEEQKRFIEGMKDKIRAKFQKQISKHISNNYKLLAELIAPNILGLDFVKMAALLMLFAKEPFHVLLLGDPGTGKTDVLRSVHDFSPISSFGLGSGTSGVGLAVSVKGNETKKGLLPLADGGICCIDELNLMKEDNRASLYNAMEKGFVSYDKAGKHMQFEAEVRVIATANPIGDKFKGNSEKELKKQMPFDSALLTRFHLVFLIRKPSLEEFREITKKIVRDTKVKVDKTTIGLFKDYVKKANSIDVYFPETFEKEIVDFVEDLKLQEHKFLVEISPRLVIGIIRMTKAAARMQMKDKVTKAEINLIEEIIRESLKR